MGKFLKEYNLPKLNQEEIENINRPITNTEIETVLKILKQQQKSTRHLKKQESMDHLKEKINQENLSLKKNKSQIY